MDANLKFKERTIALVYALVVLITLGAALTAFCIATDSIPKTLLPAANQSIVVAIALNGFFSAGVWFYWRAHIAIGTDLKRVWDLASLAILSVLLDVGALVLALTAAVTSGLYLWLGIALVVDAVIDVIVHYKR